MVESTLPTQQDPSGHRYAGEIDEDGNDHDDDHLGGEIQLILLLLSAQNDFITGSLKVGGAVGIVDPIRQLIEEEELWGQVKKTTNLCRLIVNILG